VAIEDPARQKAEVAGDTIGVCLGASTASIKSRTILETCGSSIVQRLLAGLGDQVAEGGQRGELARGE